jgi:hypothetical protein
MPDPETRSPVTVRGNCRSSDRPGSSPLSSRADAEMGNHILRHVGKQSATPDVLRRKPPPLGRLY